MLKRFCRNRRNACIIVCLLIIGFILVSNREKVSAVTYSLVNSTDVGRFDLVLHGNEQCYDTVFKLLTRNLEDDIWCQLIRSCATAKYNGECNITEEAFSEIFSPANFRGVSCPERRAGPPTVDRDMVALASFPGSGNTWTRHLAERLTGIQTGSLYDGLPTVKKTFYGENLCPSSKKMLLVKTHDMGAGKITKRACRSKGVRRVSLNKAVYILRNPFNTLVADFNYNKAGKTKVAPLKMFSTEKYAVAIKRKADVWRRHVTYWLSEFPGPVHVLVYERLYDNLRWEMFRIARFLQVPVDVKTLWCVAVDSEGAYHRPRESWMTHEVLFTDKLSAEVRQAVDNITDIIKQHHIGSDVLESYQSYNSKK